MHMFYNKATYSKNGIFFLLFPSFVKCPSGYISQIKGLLGKSLNTKLLSKWKVSSRIIKRGI